MIFSFFTICTGTNSGKKGQKTFQKNYKITNTIRYKSQETKNVRLKTWLSGIKKFGIHIKDLIKIVIYLIGKNILELTRINQKISKKANIINYDVVHSM